MKCIACGKEITGTEVQFAECHRGFCCQCDFAIFTYVISDRGRYGRGKDKIKINITLDVDTFAKFYQICASEKKK